MYWTLKILDLHVGVSYITLHITKISLFCSSRKINKFKDLFSFKKLKKKTSLLGCIHACVVLRKRKKYEIV